MKKRFYSKEFKFQAISLAVERGSISEVAKELDIRPDLLSRWKREYEVKKSEAFQGSGHLQKQKNRKLTELQALKKEVKALKLERDILKKAVSIFSKSDGLDMNL